LATLYGLRGFGWRQQRQSGRRADQAKASEKRHGRVIAGGPEVSANLAVFAKALAAAKTPADLLANRSL